MHTVPTLGRVDGGPSRTVPALCAAVQRAEPGSRVAILTSQTGDDMPVEGGVALGFVDSPKPGRAFEEAAAALVGPGGPALIHDHGQWRGLNHASATLARRLRVPRVVAPRGMLSPWARRHHRLKKTLAWWLYARGDLKQASLLHATSELEARELRDLGARQPIALVANGVDAWELLPSRAGDQRPYALFLSRLHPKKGLCELIDAWQRVAGADWDLKIAGPDEARMLAGRDLPDNIQYVGSVEGRQKQQLLQEAAFFVLPTHSENFGVVVAEALMAGTPVITTHGAPWKVLRDEQCGWWIPMQDAPLQRALREAIATPPDELVAMGRRGRELALREFSWQQAGERMAAAYRWLLDGGSPPAWVLR